MMNSAKQTLSRKLHTFVQNEDSHGLSDLLATIKDQRNFTSAELKEILDTTTSLSNSEIESDDNKNLLHFASYKLNSELIQTLLEFGANPDARDGCDRTPVLLVLQRLQGKV
jgi:hypothetical protein